MELIKTKVEGKFYDKTTKTVKPKTRTKLQVRVLLKKAKGFTLNTINKDKYLKDRLELLSVLETTSSSICCKIWFSNGDIKLIDCKTIGEFYYKFHANRNVQDYIAVSRNPSTWLVGITKDLSLNDDLSDIRFRFIQC